MALVWAWTCACTRFWNKEVKSSDGSTTYDIFWARSERSTDYGYTCTCPGFKYRGTCKHVKAIEEGERCTWNEDLDPDLLPDRDPYDQPRCPKCGGPVRGFRVMR